MDVWITRQRLDGLIKGAASPWAGMRPFTTLTHALLYARMPEKARARLLGTMSGGDDAWSVSAWWIPRIGRRELIVKKSTLAEVIEHAEPWSPPPPPDVAARQAEARARLRALRPQPPGESDQLSLL